MVRRVWAETGRKTSRFVMPLLMACERCGNYQTLGGETASPPRRRLLANRHAMENSEFVRRGFDVTKDCEQCDTTGKVHGFKCQACGGHGWTPVAEDILPGPYPGWERDVRN